MTPHSDYATLNALLNSDRRFAQERERTAFDEIAGNESRPLVLCGAGELGRRMLAGLVMLGRVPVAFTDNNATLWGAQVEGVDVLSPTDVVAKFKESAVFIVTVYNGSKIAAQLRELGCRTVSHYIPLQWKYQEVFGSNYGFGTPCGILDRSEEIQAAFKLVADEQSRDELLRQIHWRMTLEPDRLVEHWQPNETYFPPEIQPVADEVFVDCGAFTGDSIAAFLDHRGYTFRKALGIEPDPGNCEKMRERFSRSPKQVHEKISALRYAVGSSNRTLHFDVRGSAASRVSESANEIVECRTLDTLLASEEPTYIKMDIEGAEPDAIAGAAKTIQAHRPVLAVCLYHQLDHLWRVPIALHQLNPDYKLLIRRYAEDCWELVCYAVPSERLL